MIQVIRRVEGEKSQKESIGGCGVQVSYNSFGHLVVRVINGPESDTLVVFATDASFEIINFCKNHISSPKRTVRGDYDDGELPF